MTNVLQIKPRCDLGLEEKVEQLRSLDREIKKLSKIHVSLKSQITSELGDRSEIVNIRGEVIATYTTQSRTSFDKVSFDSAYPGIYAGFVKSSEIKVFRLKLRFLIYCTKIKCNSH